MKAQERDARSEACNQPSIDVVSLYATTEAEQQQRSRAAVYQKFEMVLNIENIGNSHPHPFYDSDLSDLLKSQSARFLTMTRHSVPLNKHHHGRERRKAPFYKPEPNPGSLLQDLYAKTLDMELIWNGYRRQPNKGNMTIFRLLRPSIEKLAQKMYGEDSVLKVRYGKHKDTSYIVVFLYKEPAGAAGYASDEFMGLNSNFFEVLKDGQAAEADIIANSLKPELVRRYGVTGLSLVDLFEIQVDHPISGRLLVAPIEKQRKFMGL